MIPRGWKRRSLESVAEIRTGLAKGKRSNGNVVSRPYLRVANVQDGFLNLSTIKNIEVEERSVERYSLRRGDIVLTEGGDFDKLGRGTVWNEEIPGCLHQNHVFVVRAVTGVLFPEFFAAQSTSHYGKTYYLSCAKRSTNLASINSTQLKQFPVLLPPLAEQKRIAEILSTWDRAIETTEKLIANSEAQKKALMQQLLTGKKRLPGFCGEWQKMRLDQAAHIIVSNVDKKTDAAEQPVRLCNYMDVYRANEIKNDMPFMRATATSAQIAKFGLKVGDVLITKDSETPDDIAVPSYVASTAGDLVCGYHLAIIRPKKPLYGRFLKFYFEHPHTRYFFSSRANGATRFGLTVDAIETAPILLPSIEEQTRISEVIGVAENKIASLRPVIESLRVEKSALMQQLLTGKRRVKIKGEAQAA